MLSERHRQGESHAGILLVGCQIADSVHARFPSPPVVRIQGQPQARLEVVAEVCLYGAHGVFGLRTRAGEELGIPGVKPDGTIRVQHPVPEALGIAELRLERPAVTSPVDKSSRVVLTGRCNDLEARSQKYGLPPFQELRRLHRRSAY